jgi:hypothetical protein
MAFQEILNKLPNGESAALSLINEFDQCFLVGFANLERPHQETLNALVRVFTGTPLEQPLVDTGAAIERHEFVERHFSVLAAARAAMLGSLFDTLQQQVRGALGRAEVPDAAFVSIAESELTQVPTPHQVWLESIRHWLMEIALMGYARLDGTTLLPFMATLEQIQAEPLLIRQAAVLTGFFNELISQVPVAESSSIPTYRWTDLWMQAMIGAMPYTAARAPKQVSGILELLGLDLRHHANLVSFTAYGVLTNLEQVQQVKITLSAYKVDAIAGDEIWLLFPNATSLLDAFAENQALHLSNIPLLSTGDLLWQGDGQVGRKYNLMEKAAQLFSPNVDNVPAGCLVHPAWRHPIQIADPVFLKDYTIIQDLGKISLSWKDKGVLPIATERISLFSEIAVEDLAKSTQLFGLLRFDAGRWAVQPLAVTVKGKTIFTGQSAAKIMKKPPNKNTVSILQERASRLLRKS